MYFFHLFSLNIKPVAMDTYFVSKCREKKVVVDVAAFGVVHHSSNTPQNTKRGQVRVWTEGAWFGWALRPHCRAAAPPSGVHIAPMTRFALANGCYKSDECGKKKKHTSKKRKKITTKTPYEQQMWKQESRANKRVLIWQIKFPIPSKNETHALTQTNSAFREFYLFVVCRQMEKRADAVEKAASSGFTRWLTIRLCLKRKKKP